VTDDDAEPESEYDGFLRAVARAPSLAPTPGESNFAPGAVVAGKFRVVRTVGVGGMGKVYEVEHELTRHRRALKVLHPSASANVVERFLRETTAAARIANSHIAETFDAGRLETGEPYLVMELLEGETLEERLHRVGPIAPGELAELVHQACDGIHAAHEAGIVHRDLKPDNLFVTARNGRPFLKILDFGISKFDETRTGAPGITKEGAKMGTPYYMAPEQVRGGATIGARTDVYALGVILYECASGHRPYEAAHVEQLAIHIHEGKAVPLEERMPSLPRALCRIVHQAMAVDPRRRFPSARALGEALAPFRGVTVVSTLPSGREVLARTPAPEPSRERPRRSRMLVGVAAAGLVLGSAGAFVAARSMGRAAAPAGGSSPVLPSAAFGPSVPSALGVIDPFPSAPTVALTPLDASHTATPASPAHPFVRALPVGPATPSRADKNGLARENPFR
jgi:serine/threonine protein kinase